MYREMRQEVRLNDWILMGLFCQLMRLEAENEKRSGKDRDGQKA